MITLMKLQNRLIKRSERGAVSAEYAATMAGGVGLVGILMKALAEFVFPQLTKTIGDWISKNLPFV